MTAYRRRVAVFIDYQNCYKAARQAFHDDDHDPGYIGNISPFRLARLLGAKGLGGFDLTYVGVYAGIADSSLDPKTFSARRRQAASWAKEGATPVLRPLRYPSVRARQQGEKPREKGVDVKLAIDAVMGAVQGAYDVAVIASCDTDLAPVVEALLELEAANGRPQVEVIGWKGRKNRIGVSGKNLTCRWVGDADYRTIRDQTDYNVAT